MSVSTDGPRVARGRTCGTCMMCCKVPYIAEFDKPPGVWCRHAVAGKGCNIYEDRPATCRAFFCTWMLDESLGPGGSRTRRGSSSIRIAAAPTCRSPSTRAFPTPGRNRPTTRLKGWAQEQSEARRIRLRAHSRRAIVLLPDRDCDIGAVGLDDEIWSRAISRPPAIPTVSRSSAAQPPCNRCRRTRRHSRKVHEVADGQDMPGHQNQALGDRPNSVSSRSPASRSGQPGRASPQAQQRPGGRALVPRAWRLQASAPQASAPRASAPRASASAERRRP